MHDLNLLAFFTIIGQRSTQEKHLEQFLFDIRRVSYSPPYNLTLMHKWILPFGLIQQIKIRIVHCLYQVVTGYSFWIKNVFLSLKIVLVLVNSVDPDEMMQYREKTLI